MGKKAKEHRKKIANRNERLKQERTALEKKYAKARLQYQKQIEEIMARQKEQTNNSTVEKTGDSTIPEVEVSEVINKSSEITSDSTVDVK